jgi:lantibiotic transport system ATP-binding protein
MISRPDTGHGGKMQASVAQFSDARASHFSGAQVISIQNLEKHFGKVSAVRGINLNVQRGQIYGFLGPNGAGKTTTIRMLLGLIRPSAGSVNLFGAPLENTVLGRIGALVETPSAYAHLTGRENLEVTRRMLDAPKANIQRVLELVGLNDAANRVVRGYSLGMKGRLSLAAALLNDPELLILDEPTNGLDPQGMREIRELIQSFPKQGITVLVSSHLLVEIEQIATHVGMIANGKMRFEGTLEKLRSMSQPSMLVKVDNQERALEVLAMNGIYGSITSEGIEFLEADQTARVNRALIEAGLEVSSLLTKTDSLEDLFLELTKGA